MFTNIVTT